jgi:hypothetical protein
MEIGAHIRGEGLALDPGVCGFQVLACIDTLALDEELVFREGAVGAAFFIPAKFAGRATDGHDDRDPAFVAVDAFRNEGTSAAHMSRESVAVLLP